MIKTVQLQKKKKFFIEFYILQNMRPRTRNNFTFTATKLPMPLVSRINTFWL